MISDILLYEMINWLYSLIYQYSVKMGAETPYLCQLPCWNNSNTFDKMAVASRFPLQKMKNQEQPLPSLKLELISLASTNSTSREIFLIDEQSSADKSNGQASQQSTFVQMANRFYKKGNLQAAINNYMIALHKVERKDIRMADIHFAIGQCYFRLGNFGTAIKHCKLSQTKYTELTGKMSQGVAMTCNLIGHLQSQINDYVLAQHYYQKAYQIFHQQINHNFQNLLEVGFNLGALYLNIGHDSKALDIYQQIEGLIEKDQSIARDSIILELYRCLGVNCFKLKLFERSMLYFRKAFDISLCLPLEKNNEIDKLIVSFEMIKNYILTVSKLSKSELTSLTIKRFNQLNHRMK